MFKKNILIYLILLLSLCCNKVDVTFADDGRDEDPNLSFFDDYAVDIATYKIDSFSTSSDSVFTIGHHADSAFGTITAGAYTEIDLPNSNPIKDQDVSFDSIVLILKPNGNYYGDTLLPFKVNVHKVIEKIENDEQSNTTFYNPRRFQYDPSTIGEATLRVRPKRQTELNIRLSDSFGEDLLMKLKNDDDSIQNQSDFLDYLKGLYLETDTTVGNSMYYFKPDSGGVIMRLHYKLKGAVSVEKELDFAINASKQYNRIYYNHTGTNLSSFTAFKKQLKNSSVTGNKAYLHSNMGSYIKISFPTILNIKELHPYVKIISAELVIKPSPGTFNYPYMLPSALSVYNTNDDNGIKSLLTTVNLNEDDQYGENTGYSFDITSFITALIDEGQFSESALMLTPTSGISDSHLERLVVNDQTLSKGIQLKLYVLGL